MKSFKITMFVTTFEDDVFKNEIVNDMVIIIEDEFEYLALKSIEVEETENDHNRNDRED